MPTSRRTFLLGTGALGLTPGLATARSTVGTLPPGLPGVDYKPVITPDGSSLPFRLVEGVKVFHLIAEPVQHEFAPGLRAECWGYNGGVHGPTIEAVEGDRVRIYVTNKLDTSTTVHWHGLFVPAGMDGVGGLTQRSIEPGETFRYEFTLRQHGTFMYHSHHDEMTQMAMGMLGMIVVHPRQPEVPPPDRDYVFMLSEWAIRPGVRRPDPNEMTDFNVLTFNAKAFPATTPMVAKLGERVRIRIGNLSAMDHHPIHLHGFAFEVTETDGGQVPRSARFPETTVLVPTGGVRCVEFVADAPGDWAMHCHMTHHVMTQMGHGIPNLIGVEPGIFDELIAAHVPGFMGMGKDDPSGTDTTIPPNSIPMQGAAGPFGYLTMGGMVTVLKVRTDLAADGTADAYEHPPGTVADVASPGDLARDGIRP